MLLHPFKFHQSAASGPHLFSDIKWVAPFSCSLHQLHTPAANLRSCLLPPRRCYPPPGRCLFPRRKFLNVPNSICNRLFGPQIRIILCIPQYLHCRIQFLRDVAQLLSEIHHVYNDAYHQGSWQDHLLSLLTLVAPALVPAVAASLPGPATLLPVRRGLGCLCKRQGPL
ncbi:uncharacterized protein EI90DRAFT_394132 [Cantharellus anzutake]|uniref:uncharacterized protein n=1 Tax=Cantharellus anzutake TaxID=1750568 RepID=UPI0019068B2A|nr:uncharacterized protein EI90DRAFT_394132 [Cantharellus anzutake]KAF8335045.1 hypothetical protein EI90DRAFT_394132 [Cantharellus anzutake]